MSEEETSDLPPWNDVMVGYKTMWCKSKPERVLYVPGFNVTVPINDCFTAAVDYRSYHRLKKSSRYGNDLAHELHRMAKKVAVQMKDRTFSAKDPLSVVAFLQRFKSACDADGIHEGAARWLIKQFLTGPPGRDCSEGASDVNGLRQILP